MEKGVENLRVLARCVESLDQLRIIMSHVTLQAQVQGLDFFGLSLRAAELKLSQLPPQ